MSTNSRESRITDFMAGALPWLAPIPSAVLVANATMAYLKWDPLVAGVAGAVIEGLGLTSSSTALTLWYFNARKPQDEPRAPYGIAALLLGVYFASTILLTVVLGMDTSLTHLAPAIFPVLSIVATVNIALRSQHANRLERIAAAEEAERLAAEKAEQERKRASAEAKAEQLRREMEEKADAERLRLERKADREARQAERQATRQGATRVATVGAIDRDTFVRLFTTQQYAEVEDLAHTMGFNGELRAFYESGRRSVSRLSQLVGVNPRTGQRWIDASGVATCDATDDATGEVAA